MVNKSFLSNVILKAIVAMDDDRAIGKNNQLPWHIPEDLKYFSKCTTGHTVVMGRKTYQSLPDRFRPLPNRKNIVLSRDDNFCPDKNNSEDKISTYDSVLVFKSVSDFLNQLYAGCIELPGSEVWVIGGAEIYRHFMPFIEELHLTRVAGSHDGDSFLDPFEKDFKLLSTLPGKGCSWEVYRKIV
ncbi:MAG TPA: dihydrofolate reductase [Oligoflexia bacterium]|nr:dihydrofolate reductase [Oligoflexia bacterium]HMP47837.1 dihydrofolate reductase [Oligoflexia bacterium]